MLFFPIESHLLPPLPGGSISVLTSGGYTSVLTSGGVHFHVHFWWGREGVPCDLFPWCIWCYLFALQTPTDGSGLIQLLIYTAATVHHGKVTWDPQSLTDWQTNMCKNTTHAGDKKIIYSHSMTCWSF